MLIKSREILFQLWFHICASSQLLLTSIHPRYTCKNFLSCPLISLCVAPVPSINCRMSLLSLAPFFNHLSCHSSLYYPVSANSNTSSVILKMKAASFSITLIPIYQSTWCYISEDWSLHQRSCEKFKLSHLRVHIPLHFCCEKPICPL
jgi:hypothetical protein